MRGDRCATTSHETRPPRLFPEEQPATPPAMAAQMSLPVREHCFFFNAPDGDITLDDLIDAVERTAGDDSVHVLQHMGGSRFLVCTRNAAQATKLLVSEGFTVNDQKVAVEAVGPPVTFVNVFRYPAFLPDDPLTSVLSQYGKVKSVAFATVSNRQTKLNGVRVVRIEMTKPVPNFLTVAGHRVMLEYRGMRRVCARCSEVGHMASACRTPYCTRCGTFGHGTEGCDAECKKCGGKHGTRDCFRRRSYVAAARGLLAEHGTADGLTRSRVSAPPDGRHASPNLQVLRPKSPTLSPGYATLKNAAESTSASDSSDTNQRPSSASAACSVSAQESTSAVALGDFTTGSGSESSSPDSSRDAWVVDTSASEEQDSAEKDRETYEEEQVTLSVTDREFPPLPRGPSSDANYDDTPIKSCGHYVLPSDPPAAAPRPSLKSDADISKGSGTPSENKSKSGLERRHRSRSRRRPAAGTSLEESGRAESAERFLRRSIPPEGSSDSEAARRKNPKKLRRGSVGDGPPTASVD